MPNDQSVIDTDFIQQYWQQEHRFFAQALPQYTDSLNQADVFSMAALNAFESRLICTKNCDWSCEYGAFDLSYLTQKRSTPWTLLVQGVEQYKPTLKRIFTHFSALPHCRFDDLMVSYATDGAGVGPHFDYYDVFLLQICGTRTWQLGGFCDANTPLRNHSDLQLLQDFESQHQYSLTAGDMLYVPAGMAHWGTADSDDCITLSIGFRAPSDTDILQHAFTYILDEIKQDQRYSDNLASIDADKNKINRACLQKLSRLQTHFHPNKLALAMQRAFGELVTQTSHFVPWPSDASDTHTMPYRSGQLLAAKLECAPHSRLAYSDTLLFIDGHAYPCRAELAQQICQHLINLTLTHEDVELLNTLHSQELLRLRPLNGHCDV